MSGWFHKMTYPCDEVRDFMYDFLEESLPKLTAIRFHVHLNGCADCREYLFLYKKAANAGEFRKEHPAPDALLAATLAFLQKEGIAAPPPDAEGNEGDGEPGEKAELP